MAVRNRFWKIDFSMLSSYLGRAATVLVFTAIILLALGALFLDHVDMAHMPVSVRVCGIDSARVAHALESLGEYVRERGGGIVTWSYGEYGGTRSDFFLMTSVRFAEVAESGGLACCLIARTPSGAVTEVGAVVVRSGADSVRTATERVAFCVPYSAAGHLSALEAFEKHAGDLFGRASFEFTGHYLDDERVAFGVLFGAYDAGGIRLERLRYLERIGILREGELEVVATGPPYPEIVLASSPSIDPGKRDGFVERLPRITERVPPRISEELHAIGISGFARPRERDLEAIGRLHDRNR